MPREFADRRGIDLIGSEGQLRARPALRVSILPIAPARKQLTMLKICFANNKGGCAKTTVSLNVAIALARQGAKVLAVDLDPQGNLSATLGADLGELVQTRKTAYRLMLDDRGDFSEYIMSGRPRLDVIPQCIDDAGETLVENVSLGRELMLRERLAAAENQYDFCILDTPPRMKAPTLNALALADLVVVPIDSGLYSLIGLRELLGNIGRVRRMHAPNQKVLALLSKYTATFKLDKEVRKTVIDFFTPAMVFNATIPNATGVGVATSNFQAIVESEPESAAGFAYLQLVREIREVLSGQVKETTLERITG